MASGLDELVFRATERLELLQLQVISGTNQAKEFLLRIKEYLTESWNNPALIEALEKIAETAKGASARAVENARTAWQKAGINDFPSPKELLIRINGLISNRMWRHSALIFVSGVVCGSIFGVVVGWQWRSHIVPIPHYKALHSLRDGTTVVVEDGSGSNIFSHNDVIIKVHSFSVQPLDRDVLRGRGKKLRQLVRPCNKEVTVGRSFSGMITDMGSSVRRLDIGDKVWGAFAEWEGGAAQEYITAPAHRVGRSPLALPPQAAASLPYYGGLALHFLRTSEINENSAQNKKILIIGAGSGSGCVILQLLKMWGAVTTAVCDPRAQNLVRALGAQDVVIVDWCDDSGGNQGRDANLALAEAMVADLTLREPLDYIFICHAPKVIQIANLNRIITPTTSVSDLRSKYLYSDGFGTLLSFIYGTYISFRRSLSWICGANTGIDFLLPVSMDVNMLDTLASQVENGNIQTVVDKVYSLKDFELALAHACSVSAIGCTVIRIS